MQASTEWRAPRSRCTALDKTAHEVCMKIKIRAATVAAVALTVALTGCSPAGSEARDLAERWLQGDTAAQCMNAAATWSDWELGRAERLGEVEGATRWAIEISGVRSHAPETGGRLLVDFEADGGCVRWYEAPLR